MTGGQQDVQASFSFILVKIGWFSSGGTTPPPPMWCRPWPSKDSIFLASVIGSTYGHATWLSQAWELCVAISGKKSITLFAEYTPRRPRAIAATSVCLGIWITKVSLLLSHQWIKHSCQLFPGPQANKMVFLWAGMTANLTDIGTKIHKRKEECQWTNCQTILLI